MKTRKKQYSINILIGIVFTLFLISLATTIVIHLRPLYYFDIDFLDIPTLSGIPKEIIVENYNALIDYCSPFFNGKLVFPTLPASENGLIHFEETKRIFIAFYFLLVVTTILLLFIILQKKKQKDYSYLFTSSITAIVLPLIVGIAIAFNFDQAFIVFHRIFFRNDYWIFDPLLDPIILILPDTFFLHCALFIILFVLIGSGVLFYCYKKCVKHSI